MSPDLELAIELFKDRYALYQAARADVREAERNIALHCPFAVGAVVDYEKRVGGSMVMKRPAQIRRYKFVVEGIDPYFGDPFERRSEEMVFEGWMVRGHRQRADGGRGRAMVRGLVALDGSVRSR